MGTSDERAAYPAAGGSPVLTSPSTSRLLQPNGQIPTGGSVVMLGHAPSSSASTSGLSSPTSLNSAGLNPGSNPFAGSKTAQLIDAHPTSGGTYGVPPPPPPKPFDPNEDDPLENSSHSMRSGSSNDVAPSSYVVAPSIQVRSEFPTITPNVHNNNHTHPLTCIVVVELPSRRTGPVPQQTMSVNVDALFTGAGGGPPSVMGSGRNDDFQAYGGHHGRSNTTQTKHSRADPSSNLTSPSSTSPPQAFSPIPHALSPIPEPEAVTSSNTPTPRESILMSIDAPNPAFESIALDLRTRIADWKGHPMEGLGPLQKFDILSVKRDTLVREFLVYLFK